MGVAELLFGGRRDDGGSSDCVRPAALRHAAFRGGPFFGKGGLASREVSASPGSGAFFTFDASSCEAGPFGEASCSTLILATNAFRRLRGLMGRGGFEGVCLISPCRDIHTFGMSGAIDVAFVDADGRVLVVQRGLPPGRRARVRGAACVLERFAREGLWLNEGDTLVLSVRRANDAGGSELAKKEGGRP